MDEVPGFAGFRQAFTSSLSEWKQYYDLAEPQNAMPPKAWTGGKDPNLFQKLVCLRMVRPDKVGSAGAGALSPAKARAKARAKVPSLPRLLPQVTHAVSALVQSHLDKRYVSPPPFDIARSYEDSNCLAPLIFILSPGADPMAALLKFATKMGVANKFQSISLGQGQGPIAAAMVREAQVRGLGGASRLSNAG